MVFLGEEKTQRTSKDTFWWQTGEINNLTFSKLYDIAY